MNTFIVTDLPNGNFFEADAFIDKKFIACPEGVPISAALKKSLMEWEFAKLFSEGGLSANSSLFVLDASETAGESGEPGAPIEAAKNVQAAEENQGASIVLDKELEAVKKAYDDYLEFAEDVYEKFSQTQQLNTNEITEKMKEFCVFMRKNKSRVLRLQSEARMASDKTYLAEHSLRSAVFAEAIAIQLNFPIHRMIYLAISCLLHEIGMTRLPQKLLDSNAPLSDQEKKAISVHPVLSYNILREAEFPLNICLGALEHHERENGKGYPRNLTKEQISIYAKIIAVACSYEAATSKRPFKEGMDAYSGIIDILKNEGQQYDAAVVHALLLSLSLYPIGIYVLLSDGRKGQVVDINSEDPKYPVVQLLGEYKSDGTAKTIETSEYAAHIVRPLSKTELGF